jgi:N-acetylglucosaminyldiphosphoundecaprenol N-acetyl-beta-D-mannosaminyltransferase
LNGGMNALTAPLVTPAAAPARRPATSAPPRFAPSSSARPVAVLGVPFDPVTLRGAIARIDAMIATRTPHYVATANVDFLLQAHDDVELRRILIEADLVVCDGTPIVWMSRLLGNALPERVAGSDLVPELVKHAAQKGHRLFLLGGGPGVAAAAAARLRREYPTLTLAGHYAPPFASLLEMDHTAIVERVRAARPDILLVSFGCPKQEKWIAMHFESLGVPVAIGVGATIDFLAGRVPRAPGWMRHTGTEWLFRLLQEPRRLYRRYASNVAWFFPLVARQVARVHGLPSPARPTRRPHVAAEDQQCLYAGTHLTAAALRDADAFWRAAAERSGTCVLDATAVQRVDSTGIAFLLRWQKSLRERRGRLVLLRPAPALRRALAALQVLDYFPVVEDTPGRALPGDETTAAPVVTNAGKTLAWQGEVVAANCDDAWRETVRHIQDLPAPAPTVVVVDLARLRFIDSSGAGLMLRLQKWARSRSVQILFAHASPNVRNVLRLARLDRVLLEGSQ